MASLAALLQLQFPYIWATNVALRLEIEDCYIITSITTKETAIGAITIVPIAPSSSTPSTINAAIISAPPSTNRNRIYLYILGGEGRKSFPPSFDYLFNGLTTKRTRTREPILWDFYSPCVQVPSVKLKYPTWRHKSKRSSGQRNRREPPALDRQRMIVAGSTRRLCLE
ncbi:hypothetical protein P8C59_005241 [Phyllachora maydis]|uniref:Uncharacterized protein n=1 Tax=Phyllachora maydis TaxID=1825666 RepID=A0AAD9MC23_9PEZI|nr:hypothetical protein P8C59_005241 [Phyllachora maydis]